MPVIPKFVHRNNEKFEVVRTYERYGAAKYYVSKHPTFRLSSMYVGRVRKILVLRRVG